jgi:hypothetical protein
MIAIALPLVPSADVLMLWLRKAVSISTYHFKDIQSTTYCAKHLQFDISANALEIRVVQNPKCIF